MVNNSLLWNVLADMEAAYHGVVHLDGDRSVGRVLRQRTH